MKNTKKQNEKLTDAALLRQRAEELLQRKDKACLVFTDATSEADMLKLIHELEVHQIELEMQNEELLIAKEKAELAEEKYTELYDFAPSGYFTLSRHGNMLEMNLRGAQMLGKERSLLINKQFGLFIKEDSRIVFAHFLEEIFRGKNKAICDVSLSCLDNNVMYVHLTGIISENREYCHVTAIDITERKKAEDELLKAKERAEESESKLKAALESMSDAVFISDTDGNFLDFNDAFATFHKFKNKQECAKTFKEYPVFLDVYFPNGVLAPIEKWVVPSALRGEMGINKEFTLLRRDTNETWIGSYNYAPIRNNEGDVIGSVVTCRDITEIRLKENALRESEEMMRNSQSVAHICSYSTNLNESNIEKSVWICSPEFYNIFGIDKTYPHTMAGWAAFIHPDHREEMVAYIESVVKERKSFNHEYKIIRINDGLERWVQGNGKLEFDEKGNPVRMHGAIQDITERKRLEDVHTFLSTSGYPGSSENFFELLAKYLSQILDSEYVCIDKLEGDGLTAQTVAIYNEGKFDPNVSYTLKQTPCGDVVGKAICCFPENVCQLFPHDEALQDLKAHSYIGTTLWSFDGKPIGLIAIIGQKPLKDAAFAENVLKLVSIRAADELERIQAEEKLRQSEAIKNTMVSNIGDVIVIIDQNGINQFKSPNVTKFFGWQPKELIGKNTWDNVHPDDVEAGKTFFDTIAAVPNAAGTTELRYKHKDGEYLWIEISLINLLHDKDIQGVLGNYHNITGRRQSEMQLRKLSQAIEQSPASVVITDINGVIEYVNPKFIRTTGYTLNEAKGQNPRILKSGEQTAEYYNELWQTILSGKVWRGELHNKKKNGELYWESASISPIINSEGKNTHFLAVKEDITEKKKVEQELILAKEHAEESDRLKSAFLANMSHEIRTPMNGILGFADLLKEPGLTGDEQQKYIGIIEKSGKRMLNIINDIVDISKIEAGLMKLDYSESNVNEQIEYIYTFFKPEVEAKGMKLSFRNSLTAKEAIIKTDREKLYAILTNLVKNAIKYSKEGEIEIGYDLVVETQCIASLLQFYVKDTGIGIPKNRQEAIFERFIQADIADKMARQGAGLGLTISKSYIEMLGGKIWVESEEGFGSTFYFTLPYLAEPVKETADWHSAPSEKNETVRKLKILIAEDDEVSEMLIDSYIKMYSKEILKAVTGVEAVEICRNNPDIDLILMDIRMPEMGGYEATHQIRQFNKEVVIIAQTAYGLIGDREKAIEAGCNDYISKPIKKSELLRLLQVNLK